MKIISFALLFLVGVILLTTLFNTYNNVDIGEISVVETNRSVGVLSQYDVTFHEALGVGTVRTIEFSFDDSLLAIGVFSTNSVRVYAFNEPDECYDLINPSPSAVGVGSVYGVDFNHNTSLLAVGHATSPYIRLYDVVGQSFSTVVDTDLALDGVVYDLKFYDDRYLIVGGDFTNYLQIFEYQNGDFIKLSGTIDELPIDVVWDIEYKNGYFFVATEGSPFIMVYRHEGDNLIKIDDPAVLPLDKGYSIDSNDLGSIVALGTTGSPYINVYKFENEILTPITVDIEPTQTDITWAVHFIDNTVLYTGGGTDVYKYSLNDSMDLLTQIVSDVTTFTAPVYVIDHSSTLERFSLGDSTGYDCYSAESQIRYLPIQLENEPEYINSVKQGGVLKEYILLGDRVSVIDQDYFTDIIIDYTLFEHTDEFPPLLFIIPILAAGAFIIAVVSVFKN